MEVSLIRRDRKEGGLGIVGHPLTFPKGRHANIQMLLQIHFLKGTWLVELVTKYYSNLSLNGGDFLSLIQERHNF